MTVRDEITHRVLAMTDSGLLTRTWFPQGWAVRNDHEPAPDNARWALTTLEALGCIRWWCVAENVQVAIPTPAGVAQLKRWDTQLLGPPAPLLPVPSTPPCLDDAAERLARRSSPQGRMLHDRHQTNGPHNEDSQRKASTAKARGDRCHG